MTSSTNVKLQTALKYQALGLSIIPVGPGKKPLISTWKPYQLKSATPEEILTWWSMWPDANPAVVTGAVSGLIALDIDAKEKRSSAEFQIPVTACAKSGNNGEHFYFKYPGTHVDTKAAISEAGVDIRGDGGYILLPPSVNDKGGIYEWIIPLENVATLADTPTWLLEKVRTNDKKWDTGKDGVSLGARNDTAASMAGKIFSTCTPELWDTLGWEQFQIWNNKNTPPLALFELKSIWESIKKYPHKNPTKEEDGSQADKLVRIVRENPAVLLFRNELDEPFIQFPVGNHKEYWPCKDKMTKYWLSREFWNRYQKSANGDAINTALSAIQGFALYDGAKFVLSNRIANYNEGIFYSLSNENWEAIHITKEGWSIIKEAPILFRRYAHQMPQIYPVKGGNIWDIFTFVNLKNEDQKILFIVWLISCFIPDFPHPILYMYGPQGSAKSTASRLLKKLIDPSKLEVFEIPKDQKELVQKLSHHACLMFDNISYISSELSDILCRAVTGSGFSKRELYSDDSDVIYTFKRNIGINGINLLAIKPDLLERSVLIELERVSKESRKNEQELLEAFDAALPGLLGAIFDTVSSALRIRPSVELTETPRMADFASWGYAIAEAIGYGGKDFIDCYLRNINLQHEEIVGESFEASFIIRLMEEQDYWEGSASELLKLMSASPDLDERKKELPKTPQALSHKLNILKTNLAEFGIIIERIGGPKRKIIIRKQSETIANVASSPSEEEMFGLIDL